MRSVSQELPIERYGRAYSEGWDNPKDYERYKKFNEQKVEPAKPVRPSKVYYCCTKWEATWESNKYPNPNACVYDALRDNPVYLDVLRDILDDDEFAAAKGWASGAAAKGVAGGVLLKGLGHEAKKQGFRFAGKAGGHMRAARIAARKAANPGTSLKVVRGLHRAAGAQSKARSAFRASRLAKAKGLGILTLAEVVWYGGKYTLGMGFYWFAMRECLKETCVKSYKATWEKRGRYCCPKGGDIVEERGATRVGLFGETP